MRKHRGLTQQALAYKAGLSKVTINHLERGKAEISLGNLNKIAEALECELEVNLKEKSPS